MNLRVIANFISEKEQSQILNGIAAYSPEKTILNRHIKEINDHIKGFSVLCDLSKTGLSNYISQFQGDNTNVDMVSPLIISIKNRIINELELDGEHNFVQIIGIDENGQVKPHYDAAAPGYITYKCNVAISGPENDKIFVGKDYLEYDNRNLYCFEASLYKHWLEPATVPRVLLSYGFLVPYENLGWEEADPRVKMSRKIYSHFQMAG